jgi:hypothetical protein
MSRSARSADDVPVNQSTYEHLRPDGFIKTARPQHRSATLIRHTGRLAEGPLEDNEQVRVTRLDIGIALSGGAIRSDVPVRG